MDDEMRLRVEGIGDARARARAKMNLIIASQVRNEPHTELHFVHM